ncbi:xanthine dehydrogenase small subunit [Rhodoferax sp. AJA081-3]|uniref:xanthine dehydrogenase small subunit n=1 Tax=Rhodoferax sp. AJA081-3 TaxID=2752316 RepID=UPI001ADF6050|nr:xanthine dehydrogenase small subunit [Rhodoferax sp. AJA081-3]
MPTQPLRFVRRGEIVTLPAVEPSRTLLDVLREDLHNCGTKEGCGEGDCGACTVVIAEPDAKGDGKGLKYSAINSCIRLAHSINGMALWTIEDLKAADGSLHPAQQAMVDCHGSQCGFCTPGFVMSLFGQYQSKTCKGQAISRADAQAALSGNLCRCTGYRPILDAAEAMQALPLQRVNEAEVLSNIERISKQGRGLEANFSYMPPQNLPQLLTDRARHPDAQLVAGCTDVGLWVTKMHMQFAKVLDVTQVAELRRVEQYPHHIAIGAAVSLTDAFAALVADRPQLAEFAHRFAGLPVRNSGTLGGNVANGSPIGDSMPLLIALGAHVVLMRQSGKKQAHRSLPLEDLYTGYRKNVMAPDEVLAWIKVPKTTEGEFSRVYKISKRFEDDISAVCLAINLHISDGVVRSASIGAGGVAATPVRARKTEAALVGQPWTEATIQQAMQTLRDEFSPISDMRATAGYRSTVLGNLLQRFWLESQGCVQTDLRSLEVAA